MTAYVIVGSNTSEVADRAQVRAYLDACDASVIQYGGETVLGTGDITVLEGTYDYARCKVICFPDVEAAVRWHHSPEFQYAMTLRPPEYEGNKIVVPDNYIK